MVTFKAHPEKAVAFEEQGSPAEEEELKEKLGYPLLETLG